MAIALAVSVLIVSVLPASTLATDPTAPYLDVRDAPLTRNQTVQLRFQGPLVNPPAVTAYYASNEYALDGQGHLVGTAVPWSGPWTLATGAAGPRTIYGQIQYATGGWSAILELDLILATDAGSAMAVDIDPQDSAPSSVLRMSGGHQWQEVLRTPSEHFYASATGTQSFVIFNSFWDFYFSTASGPFAPGHYELGPFDSDGNCIGNCGDVVTETATSCRGTHSGWFHINSISFADEGDVRSADVDFRIVCRNYLVMAGTVLYGTEHDLTAIQQDAHAMTFPATHIGGNAAWQTLTLTNIGDADLELGDAAVLDSNSSSTRPTDFEIGTDSCSGATLEADDECAVSVRYNPTVAGSASAFLSIPDNTLRGSRDVALRGQGQQQVTVEVEVDASTAAPGPVSVSAVVSPAAGNCFLQLIVEGIPDFHPEPSQWTYQTLTNPSRFVQTWTASLPPGNYTASASTGNCFGYLGSSDSTEFSMTGETTPPTGSMVINGGSGITNAGDVRLDLSASDASGISKLAVAATQRAGSETWILYDPTSTLTLGLYPEDATYTVMARWRDGVGNWSEPVSQTITLDTVAPVVQAPEQQFVTGTSIVNGALTLNVPWSASDAGTGVDAFELQQRTDGKTWVPVTLPGPALVPSNTTISVLPGHSYAFRVRGSDVATNTSQWSQGPALNIKKFQEGSARITYNGKWVKKSAQSFWGGAAKASVKSGATASLTFTGRSFGWVTTYGPDRGNADVYVNGVLTATVDLYSSTVTNKRVAWAGNWATSAARTITIKVLATTNRPRVDIDALITAQ